MVINIFPGGNIFSLTNGIFYNIGISYKYYKFWKKDKSNGDIDCFPSR
jgi:hypothetical protein